MIGRLKRLFARYAARHLRLEMLELTLPLYAGSAPNEEPAGQVTQIVLENNQLRISGTVQAKQVVAENTIARRVDYPRPAGEGCDELPKFTLRLPFDPGATQIGISLEKTAQFTHLPQFARARVAFGNLRLVPGFLVCVSRALPAAFRWFRHQDPAARVEVRNLLGLAPLVDALRLDDSLFQPRGERASKTSQTCAPFVIVMPVHNAFEVLQEALERVDRHTGRPWKMVLIEDCSTDVRVRPYLQSWAKDQGDHVTLLENVQNLGFIGSVNRGFACALDLLQAEPEDSCASVVLLNSDALVPEDWVARLVAPIATDASVASVTPMSNDAELMTVPQLCARHSLLPGVADQVDALARTLPVGRFSRGRADMPAGVGFCMALALRYLRWLPELDTAFGAGYGEEVDWCQKAIERGGRHVAQPGLFVEHRGGASFGSEEKQRLIAKNGELISKRYPQFDQQVQNFIADDPLLSVRLALGLAWVAAQAVARNASAVPVYVGHSMGGGAELDLLRRVAADIKSVGAAVVLRIGGTLRWQLELHSEGGITRGATDNTDFLEQMLTLLPTRRMIYSCGVGDSDPAGLPKALLRLGAKAVGGYEVLFHDFLPLSPSYTLLDIHGKWNGVPTTQAEAGSGKLDRAHIARRPDGSRVALSAWREAWGELLVAADRIEVFSENSRSLVVEAYPNLADRITVAPHELLHPVPKVTVRRRVGGVPVIGVLGNVGSHKGAGVLKSLSLRLAKSKEAGLVLIGNLDPSYELASPAVVYGNYQIDEIPDLVARYGITCWLIPSIWPETFSFVTHEALATGLPVLAFDLGAQGDTVAAAERGHVVSLANGAPDLDNLLELITHINHVNEHE